MDKLIQCPGCGKKAPITQFIPDSESVQDFLSMPLDSNGNPINSTSLSATKSYVCPWCGEKMNIVEVPDAKDLQAAAEAARRAKEEAERKAKERERAAAEAARRAKEEEERKAKEREQAAAEAAEKKKTEALEAARRAKEEEERRAKAKARAEKAAATRAANEKKRAEERAREQERLREQERKRQDRIASLAAIMTIASIISIVAFVIGCFMKSVVAIILFYCIFQVCSGFLCYYCSRVFAKYVYISYAILVIIAILVGWHHFGEIGLPLVFLSMLSPILVLGGPMVGLWLSKHSD
jgi:uncharacterized membrane protein